MKMRFIWKMCHTFLQCLKLTLKQSITMIMQTNSSKVTQYLSLSLSVSFNGAQVGVFDSWPIQSRQRIENGREILCPTNIEIYVEHAMNNVTCAQDKKKHL